MIFIELNKINKYYGTQQVLKDLSLHIPQGSIYGLLGPNGSGKTTTIRVINGVAEKTSGRIFLKGEEILDPNEKKINHIAGILTENAGNYETLTAMQNLLFFGKLYNLNEETILNRAQRLMKKLEIDQVKDKKVKTFSTGMKKRLNLVRALLPDPEVLFLDEPTSGLDPETSDLVNNLIQELANNGKTIVLCTHQLRYAEEICTHYGFIKEGHLMAEGTYEELLNQFNESMYLRLTLSQYPYWLLKIAKMEENSILIPINDAQESSQIIKQLVNENIDVYFAEKYTKSLKDLYFNIVEGGMGDANFNQSND